MFPDSSLAVVRKVTDLRAIVDGWRQEDAKIALVPTMGALHEGHLSLVRAGVAHATKTVVSIFVNPSQFAPTEDFRAYPRDEARDIALLEQAGCDLLFAPSADEMYPGDFMTEIAVPGLSDRLCGVSRPHFFGGVATVVCKLLNQTRPDIAVFGEKDFQQLQIIRRMTRDLDIPVEIASAPIIREADGLAMSSRNRYLSPADRQTAAALNRALAAAADRLGEGCSISDALNEAQSDLSANGLRDLDYLEVRYEENLALADGPTLDPSRGRARIFAAVMLGRTRLIDNWPAPAPID